MKILILPVVVRPNVPHSLTVQYKHVKPRPRVYRVSLAVIGDLNVPVESGV